MKQGGLSAATLALLRRLATRHCANRHEADDVVQDILLSALETGRDCTHPRFAAWACGAVRLRARFIARGMGRQRQRETAYAVGRFSQETEVRRIPDAVIATLPPAQHIVALLINLGMGRREIVHLLGLTDVTLRQRLSGLRRAIGKTGQSPERVPELDDIWSSRGLARRALKASLPKVPGRLFAIRDPDGLPLFFSTAHISAPGGNMGRNPHHGETDATQI